MNQVMCSRCEKIPAGVTHVCFPVVTTYYPPLDTRVCRRCAKEAWRHQDTAGIGLVCPVQVTVFQP